MTLGNPELLQLGIGLTLLILVGLWSHGARRRRLAEFLGGRRAVSRLSLSDLYRPRLERALFLGISGLALAIAAAEPRRTEQPPEAGPAVKKVIIAIDVSASMQASDVQPTRLARATGIAGQLLESLEEHRVGLLLFAGTGYPLAPPTHDHEALKFLLEGVTPTIASALDPGTLVSAGIQEAVALLDRAAEPLSPMLQEAMRASPTATDEVPGERLILLIGDGETGDNDEGVTQALELAAGAEVGIHTVGVGTQQGGGMIMPPGTYQLGGPVLDESGARGLSRLQESLLREVAESRGGRYANGNDDNELRALQSELQEEISLSDLTVTQTARSWLNYDLALLFGMVALVLVFIEGLLDVTLLRRWPARWGRTA